MILGPKRRAFESLKINKMRFSYEQNRSKMNLMDIDKENHAESGSPWGPRIPVVVDADSGTMSAGQACRPIDINGDVSLGLSSYLSMVYELRSQTTGVIPLRQEDVISLADAFEMDETAIAERLARLMHCDDLQTHRFIQMIKKGRVLVPVSMVAAGAILAAGIAISSQSQIHNPNIESRSRATVEVSVTTTTTAQPSQVSVDIGEAAQVQRATVADEVAPSSSQQTTSQAAQGNAPEVGPGEVMIGDGISVSRDD